MVGVRERDVDINRTYWQSDNSFRSQGGSFKLKKIEKISEQPVANAIITLEKEIVPHAQTFTFCAKKATNILGLVEFTGLTSGRYRMKEEHDKGVPYRQRLTVEPSDGVDDQIYYYFTIDAKQGRGDGEVSVLAYNMQNDFIEENMTLESKKKLRYIISSDPQGRYRFAAEELVVSDGDVYTGNYYAKMNENGLWQLIEHASGFVPLGQMSIHNLPVGTYYMRPTNTTEEETALQFQVTNSTRAVFLDYMHQKTYELLKANDMTTGLGSFSSKYNDKKTKKSGKKLIVWGTVVVGLTFLGAHLKRTLDE